MSVELIFTNKFKNKFETDFPNASSFTYDDVLAKITEELKNINEKYTVEKIDYVKEFDFSRKELSNIGALYIDKQLALIISIIPKLIARNGYISQQLYPLINHRVTTNITSVSNDLVDVPVYIFDLLEDKPTKYQLVTLLTSLLIGFKYIPINGHNLNENLTEKGLPSSIDNIVQFNEIIKSTAKGDKINPIFELNEKDKVIKILKSTLKPKDGVYFEGLSNEPYYFGSRLYPALHLAAILGYQIDDNDFDSYTVGTNINIDSMIKYIDKIKSRRRKTMQTIYYGAPGTGKSHMVQNFLSTNQINEENIFRVTFHPEYSYSDFVGQILPMKKNNEITYDFNEGIFLKALKKAYSDINVDIYLVIEEMSRGNCAAIFGDIFQLLDRHHTGIKKGYSKFGISNDLIANSIPQCNKKVHLPANLHIIGTLNTSDQNVYPLDTAFKRRFDWKFISTTPNKTLNNFSIKVQINQQQEKEVNWNEFYVKINKFISSKNYLDLGEDKQIGQFFIDKENLNEDTIPNKLFYYLWYDVEMISFKPNLKLFNDEIDSFSSLVDFYKENKIVFSKEFLSELQDNNEI